MDMMKEALRRKILEMKGGGGKAMIGDSMESDPEKNESDLAPGIEGDAGDTAADAPAEEIDQERLLEILAALADHESGSGRSPNGLQERAAVGAREKLAKMKGKSNY